MMKPICFFALLSLPLFTGCATSTPGSAESPGGTGRTHPTAEKPTAAEAGHPAEPAQAPAAVRSTEIDYTSPYGSVRRHGRLRTEGNRIVDELGLPVSLAGNSFFWSQWQSRFYNASVVQWLKQDWRAGIVRAAMGVEGGGYLERPEEEKAHVCALVDGAIAADIYVIVDWHDHYANRHTAQAVAFFQDMARKYGRRPNILYEIFNEPWDNISWHDEVKPYAETVIAAIRAIDPNNIIIVGSPHWSQDVDVAADDPIKGKNIAYSLHFYAGTHKQALRDKALKALHKGVPLIVSEWGTCNADGNGGVDEASVREWMDFMQQWGLSHCNWAVSDKNETASIVKPGASSDGHWSDGDLTPSGRLVREWTRSWAAAGADR